MLQKNSVGPHRAREDARMSTKGKKIGTSKRSMTCSFCFKKGHTKRKCESKIRHDRDPDSYMPSSASEEEDEDMDHEVPDDDDDVDDAPSVWMGGDGDVDGDVDAEEEDGDAFASILLSMGQQKVRDSVVFS